MLNLFYGYFFEGRAALGLLVVRAVFGLGLVLHGLPKMSAPFSWMNQMAGDGAPPGILQALAAFSEFGGGLAILVGLLTPLAALGVAATMSFAIFTVSGAGHPFVGSPGAPSYESAAGYLAIALLMLVTGPRTVSLDWLLLGKRHSATGDARTTTTAATA